MYREGNLYDFLFRNNFDAWFLNSAKSACKDFYPRSLKDFILQLHTGESLVAATPSWEREKRRTLGQRILKELAECLINLRQTDPNFEHYSDYRKKLVDEMQRSLELDGYIYRQGILWVPEETVIEEKEEEDVLEGLIAAVGLADPGTLKHHLALSASHYQESRWDDSIANSRKVLEGVLQQVAERHGQIAASDRLTTETLAKPFLVRDYLEKVGLLEHKEKETVSQVYGLLSNTGAHPYVAQRDQARLMRHLSLTFCQFVLLRLEGALRSKPRPEGTQA